jgi:hypothetical protein
MTNAVNQLARTHMRSATSLLVFAIVSALALVASDSARAQTFTVLYTFTNTADGEQPDASLFLAQPAIFTARLSTAAPRVASERCSR